MRGGRPVSWLEAIGPQDATAYTQIADLQIADHRGAHAARRAWVLWPLCRRRRAAAREGVLREARYHVGRGPTRNSWRTLDFSARHETTRHRLSRDRP